MTIAEAVKRYLEIAGEYGKVVPLASFGLPKPDTERLFAAWDEDYQISRFMLLTAEASQDLARQSTQEVYKVNGFDCTHVTLQPGIQELL
jgi:hypothetical protein